MKIRSVVLELVQTEEGKAIVIGVPHGCERV
jgi:hypothetical protein